VNLINYIPMKRITISLTSSLCMLILSCSNGGQTEKISFYKVPLVCGADKSIGCGSRIKPLFINAEKEAEIKESWTNRQGTVIAIVWNGAENEKLIQTLFEKNDIEGKLVFDSVEVKKLSSDFREKDKWLLGMDVDQLSIHEAGTIASDATKFAKEKGIINEDEASKIKADIEEYFKKELVKVRTNAELGSEETNAGWMQAMYDIYVRHIGQERADKAKDVYSEYQEEMRAKQDACCESDKEDKCCKKKTAEVLQSEITCPKCGHKEMETMPTDVCVLKYTCKKCKADLYPQKGDCCVFCTYGTHKCPSKQG
jgi:hypothetical protein